MKQNRLQEQLFVAIYCQENAPLFNKISCLIELSGEHIVNEFYSTLTSFKESESFLTNEIVETRLKKSLYDWLLFIFNLKLNNEFSSYVDKQQIIGNVHARIQIPMDFVSFGVDCIKQQLYQQLSQQATDCKEELSLIHLINRTIDLAVTVFNHAYFNNSIKQERNEQNLRQHYISHNLAIEFEQSRSDLLHWQRELITLLFYPYSKLKTRNILPVSESKFGLWVSHRAAMLFYNQSEVNQLKHNLKKIDLQLELVKGLNQKENWEQLAIEITALDVLVTNTDWLLAQVAKDIVALENNKDPLTQMFTRRYLPNIIQHEIQYCLSNDLKLGVVMIDLDNFKSVNDQYGHAVGDTILQQTASVLTSSIRAYDYIFRYGGEEFLIIINNTDESMCLSIAEEIRSKVDQHKYSDLPFIKENVTISLGVSIFDRHPDYEQLIDHADQALYLAKSKGRNRVELYTKTI